MATVDIELDKKAVHSCIDDFDIHSLTEIYGPVSYTHLTLPTTARRCRSRWSPYH